MKLDNALRIDLEYWYSDTFVQSYSADHADEQIPESVIPILELLDRYNTKATFAVLGVVAERYPELVKEIFDNGHEIASHCYSHKLLHQLGKEEFEQEIIRSVHLLLSITGERPIGFTAPSYSLSNATRWALEILHKHGFKYDASIFPIKTFLYGEPKAPLYPYRISRDDVTKEDANGDIIEFPLTVLKLGINIPVAGGFYLRVLPSWFLEFALKKVNQTRPGIVYIHPWETYLKTPRVNRMPYLYRFINYYGIGKALEKLERLLTRFKFKPIREVLSDIGFL